ncbi:MAG: hypothetical protein AB1414_19085, partial [bacterium]
MLSISYAKNKFNIQGLTPNSLLNSLGIKLLLQLLFFPLAESPFLNQGFVLILLIYSNYITLDIQVFLRLSGLSFFNRKERKEINRKERKDYRLFTTLLIPS